MVQTHNSFHSTKECLWAYFNMGKAKWSQVVEAIKEYPISNSRLARKIAEDHGLPFKDEL